MKQADSGLATALPATDNVAGLTVVQNPTQKEELEFELQQKREQLLLLRRQQEELERQKGDLEDLRRKHEEYARGKAEMIEQLTRGLVVLEREQIEAQRRVESCSSARQSFREGLERLQTISDEEWTSANVRAELSQALGIVENSRTELRHACARLDCLNPKQLAEEEGKDEAASEFWRYFRLGFAASLPVIMAGTVWLIIFLVTRN